MSSWWMHGRRVDFRAEEVVKLTPSSSPQRGEHILVNGERCRVTRCKVSWREPGVWTIRTLRVKADP